MDHNILVWYKSIHSVVPSFPPVVRGSLVKKQRCALLEGKLPTSPAGVVEPSDGFDWVGL